MPRTVRLFPLLLLAACGRAETAEPGYAVRDSAGVEIAESTAPAWADGEQWRLSEQPVLQIGEMAGPEAYQLHRVAGAIRLSDGSMAVANGGSSEIRVFSADGRHLRTMGGRGGGPGEFQLLASIGATPDDSILAFDLRERRLTVFAPDGALARTATLASVDGRAPSRFVGRLADGTLVAQTNGQITPGSLQGGGLTRVPANLMRHHPDGTVLAPLAELAGDERLVSVGDGIVSVMMLPHLRGTRAVASGGEVYAGDTDRYEVRRYAEDGAVTRIIRRVEAPRPVTPTDIEALNAWRQERAGTPERVRQAEEQFADAEYPETMPAFSNLLLDDGGYLWVQDFAWPDGAAPAWSIFDPAGRWLGRLEMPERFRPMHIGDDFILGVWVDDLDVEHVRMYALTR